MDRRVCGPARTAGEGRGGCSRARTCDPLIKSQLLYLLSYTPVSAAPGGQILAGEGADHSQNRRRGKLAARRAPDLRLARSPPPTPSSKQGGLKRDGARGRESEVARRDIKGVVDFAYLEGFAAGDEALVDEVLEIFREQSVIWGALLRADHEGWRDAAHTLKGAARGVGAFALGDACEICEAAGPTALAKVRDALDAALADIAAYAHERALRSLKAPGRGA